MIRSGSTVYSMCMKIIPKAKEKEKNNLNARSKQNQADVTHALQRAKESLLVQLAGALTLLIRLKDNWV